MRGGKKSLGEFVSAVRATLGGVSHSAPGRGDPKRNKLRNLCQQDEWLGWPVAVRVNEIDAVPTLTAQANPRKKEKDKRNKGHMMKGNTWGVKGWFTGRCRTVKGSRNDRGK